MAQIRAIDIKESQSAFDSELALLWWPPYPKARWTINPLDWHYAGRAPLPKHTLMVMRLDGPTEQSVHDLIETGLKVEAEGLKGEVVLDARGKPPTEPYGAYDQTIRNLAELLRNKTSLKVVLDDKESLIPRDSEKDIAIYCGWYSLQNYVSPGRFVPGVVGFHVASAEMVSLHNPGEKGWCRNLMNAGVVATLGPVAEPYLQSFPPADEFFPLLMTGKLSLAEVLEDYALDELDAVLCWGSAILSVQGECTAESRRFAGGVEAACRGGCGDAVTRRQEVGTESFTASPCPRVPAS